MNGVFGAANGPELEMFVYSSKLEARIVTPAANLTGTMFRGTMRLGQLFRLRNAATSFVDLKVTVGDLIRASDHIQAMQSKFSLHSAMVNDYIISTQIRNDGYKFTDYIKDTNLAMEIVDYVVLQTPTLTITDGTLAKFSLICELESNLAVFPSPMNLVLYRTFNTISHRKQTKEIDYNYSPVDYKILDKAKPPTNYDELERLESKMDSSSVIHESAIPETHFEDPIEGVS